MITLQKFKSDFIQEVLFPISDSSIIAAVMAFLCVMWGTLLAFFGQKYKLVIDREYSLL